MAAGEQRDHRSEDHFILPHENLRDLRRDPVEELLRWRIAPFGDVRALDDCRGGRDWLGR